MKSVGSNSDRFSKSSIMKKYLLVCLLLIVSCVKEYSDNWHTTICNFYYVNSSSHSVKVSLTDTISNKYRLDSIINKKDTVQLYDLHNTEPFGPNLSTVVILFDSAKCLTFAGKVTDPKFDIRTHSSYSLVVVEKNEIISNNYYYTITDSLYSLASDCK